MESLLVPLLMLSLVWATSAGSFYENFDVAWGGNLAKILNNGQVLSLSLNRASGSGVKSKSQYLYGKFDVQMKLVPDNSAGIVTTFYLSSLGSTHDEIDIEFLGNLSGQPYILHTNVYTQGKGNREQQFYLWFDPTKDFHTYSILWNPLTIIFSVDGIAVRQFKNLESRGIPFPRSQAMWLFGSLWDAEDWATRGGLVKTDWSNAPFTATYRHFAAHACVRKQPSQTCSSSSRLNQALGFSEQKQIRWAQKHYMVYNYCTDTKRFPQGLPPECSFN